MEIHFIAIGGSAMHNLAIALHIQGHKVSGSDDQIFEPSRTRLFRHGLLPDKIGWYPGRLHKGLDAVIVGMHAKGDNPELARSQELGLKVFSYPEFLYYGAKNKTRIVIGGSHGKTTITAMIMHVLKYHNIDADYMVGALIEGFDVMVKLTDDAPVIVMEGDEYPSSPIDPRPKFHLYKPHVAVISGIAWDHVNVFKTYDDYLEQFRKFIHCIEDEGKLIYCSEDKTVTELCETVSDESLCLFPYALPGYRITKGQTYIIRGEKSYPIRLFGKHNLLNLNAARMVLAQLGVSDEQFFDAMQEFKGAGKRMEIIYRDESKMIIRDFAHAPSKLKATVEAVKEQYPSKHLLACMELHTYSSLSKHFLSHYEGCMDAADEAIVFYSPHALELKRLPALAPETVAQAFKKPGIKVFNDKNMLERELHGKDVENTCFLMMSSGDFGGMNFREWARSIAAK